ncbi:hypothetical protein H2203_000390 [Taxawa tesnikishii (nom. ined.)]|nr:hypothetical protein H2203_000390 [Dothideales sp. JES 119]
MSENNRANRSDNLPVTPSQMAAANLLVRIRNDPRSPMEQEAQYRAHVQATASSTAANPSAPTSAPANAPPNTPVAARSAPINTPAPSPGGRGALWTDHENNALVAVMTAVVNAGLGGVDARFNECSTRLLQQYGIQRSAAAVKNQWNRRLREQSGVEDRSRPYSGNASTSLLGKKKQ